MGALNVMMNYFVWNDLLLWQLLLQTFTALPGSYSDRKPLGTIPFFLLIDAEMRPM